MIPGRPTPVIRELELHIAAWMQRPTRAHSNCRPTSGKVNRRKPIGGETVKGEGGLKVGHVRQLPRSNDFQVKHIDICSQAYLVHHAWSQYRSQGNPCYFVKCEVVFSSIRKRRTRVGIVGVIEKLMCIEVFTRKAEPAIEIVI